MEARVREAREEVPEETLTEIGENLIARAPLLEGLATEAGNAG